MGLPVSGTRLKDESLRLVEELAWLELGDVSREDWITEDGGRGEDGPIERGLFGKVDIISPLTGVSGISSSVAIFRGGRRSLFWGVGCSSSTIGSETSSEADGWCRAAWVKLRRERKAFRVACISVKTKRNCEGDCVKCVPERPGGAQSDEDCGSTVAEAACSSFITGGARTR